MAALSSARSMLLCTACALLALDCGKLVGAEFDDKHLAPNTAPNAALLDVVAIDNRSTSGELPGSDADPGDTLTYSLSQRATLADVAVQPDGRFTYKLSQRVWGKPGYQDAFVYQVRDRRGEQATATVYVKIVPDEQSILGSFEPGEFTLPREGSRLGSSVRFDGERAIIGGYIGAAYIAERQETGAWKLTQKIAAPDPISESWSFGFNADLSGEWALIGAFGVLGNNGGRPGKAFFYHRGADGAFTSQPVTSVDGTSHGTTSLGNSVAIDGTTAAIAAKDDGDGDEFSRGAVFVYELQDDNWTFAKKVVADDGNALDFFGTQIALENGILAVTAPLHDLERVDNPGAVYLFDRARGWAQTAKLSVTGDNAANARLGTVSLSRGELLCGLPNYRDGERSAGLAEFFKQNEAGTWIATTIPRTGQEPPIKDREQFGLNVALDGNVAVVTMRALTDEGTGFLYYRQANGSWEYGRQFGIGETTVLGWSAAVVSSPAYTTVALGAPSDLGGGTVYFYNVPSSLE